MNQTRFQPGVKRVLTACFVVSTLLLSTPDAFAQRAPKSQKVPQNFSILPMQITGVIVQDGQLVAQGLLGTHSFTAPLTLGTHPGTATSQNGTACPILDLRLGPIDLNLLGLRVQTSPICLQVTAYEGGGLLGDLLCSVANLLQGGTSLADVLGLLQAQGTLTQFLNGLTQILNGAVSAVTANTIASHPAGGIAASCTVLDLSLGPIQLNLLGLEVILDNCNNGPVTVKITAIPGGGLLGDLLCSLSDVLSGPALPTAVQALLWQISRVLAGILG
jgi:hypothetical protein